MAAETPTTLATSTDGIPKKKASAKKKKRISKHILQANKDRETSEKTNDATGSLPASTPIPDPSPVGKNASNSNISSKPKKSKGAANSHMKDIKEAAGYLSNWKQYRQQWKFNKNTQSWLIRHMYEADKVAKGSFTILLEYLGGLQSDGAKARIVQEATRRALRYKKYSEGGDTMKADDANDDEVEDNKNEPVEGEGLSKKKKTKKDTTSEEEKRWNALGDHDKRKEYKRARKVLETLREPAAKKD